MATNSVYKNVVIRNKSLAKNLVHALEECKNKRSKDVIMSKMINEVKGNDIKKFFGD